MTWEEAVNAEKSKKYYQELMDFIDNAYNQKEIYPPKKAIFKALEVTPLENVKVVIIGQDPYATPGYAMGLAFSVNDNIEIPKSLQNIYKEINLELGIEIPQTGNLLPWAKNGVLLLNRILTVERNKPLAHKNIGWEEFTLSLIRTLNNQNQKIVFLLLGKEAANISKYLNNPNHLVLITSHPSPLGAYRGFIGSNIFKKTCEYLNLSSDLWRL